MSKAISIRILEHTGGRFFTVMTKDGKSYNGKLNRFLTNNSEEFIYVARSHDSKLFMIRRTDVSAINGELCRIQVEG